jgi:hypothetical protein
MIQPTTGQDVLIPVRDMAADIAAEVIRTGRACVQLDPEKRTEIAAILNPMGIYCDLTGTWSQAMPIPLRALDKCYYGQIGKENRYLALSLRGHILMVQIFTIKDGVMGSQSRVPVNLPVKINLLEGTVELEQPLFQAESVFVGDFEDMWRSTHVRFSETGKIIVTISGKQAGAEMFTVGAPLVIDLTSGQVIYNGRSVYHAG